MKNRTLIFGLIVAAICAFTVNQSQAQTIDPLGIKVLPTSRQNEIKLIYVTENETPVDIKFLDENGIIKEDKIKAGSFNKGFAKNYKVDRLHIDEFWVQVNNSEMSVTYKVTTDETGKWLAHVENSSNNLRVASK